MKIKNCKLDTLISDELIYLAFMLPSLCPLNFVCFRLLESGAFISSHFFTIVSSCMDQPFFSLHAWKKKKDRNLNWWINHNGHGVGIITTKHKIIWSLHPRVASAIPYLSTQPVLSRKAITARSLQPPVTSSFGTSD